METLHTGYYEGSEYKSEILKGFYNLIVFHNTASPLFF